jgi:hypothetical protein
VLQPIFYANRDDLAFGRRRFQIRRKIVKNALKIGKNGYFCAKKRAKLGIRRYLFANREKLHLFESMCVTRITLPKIHQKNIGGVG